MIMPNPIIPYYTCIAVYCMDILEYGCIARYHKMQPGMGKPGLRTPIHIMICISFINCMRD